MFKEISGDGNDGARKEGMKITRCTYMSYENKKEKIIDY